MAGNEAKRAMLPKYCLIDDFLEPELLDRLRAHVIASEDSFKPTKVRDSGSSVRKGTRYSAG